MATWGAYFTSYVKKKEDGTLISVPEITDTKASEESQPNKGMTIGVQRSNTAPKKLYGATIEEPSAPQIQRSASNAVRVANLFGYAKPKPTLTQVVEDSEKTDSGVTARPSPIVAQVAEKSAFAPVTVKPVVAAKPVEVKPVEEAKVEPKVEKVEVAPPTKSLFKPWSFAKTVQRAVKVEADKKAEEVNVGPKNESNESTPAVKAEVKTMVQPKNEPKMEPAQLATRAVTVQAETTAEEVRPQPQSTITPALAHNSLNNTKRSLRNDFPETSKPVANSQISTNYIISSKPLHARKATLDDIMRDLYDMPSELSHPSQATESPPQPLVVSRPTIEEEAPKRSITRSATKSSLDDVMMTLQSMPTEVKAKSPTKLTQRSRGAPKQSISDSLDDIMLALQGDIVPVKAKAVLAPVSVERSAAKSAFIPEKLESIPASPMPFEAKTANLPPLTTRLPISEPRQMSPSPISRQSSSTTRSRLSFTSSISATQPETPDSEVESVDFVESRAWQHARRISEFKLQQERMEEERKKMLEDQLKFQREEARFKEEEEQQRMFVEIVREEQEREEKEEAERQRVAQEERMRLEVIASKEEDERQRALAEERRIAEDLAQREEEERQRAAEQKSRKAKEWEEERARNAAEVAKLIREEEEREEREMQELKRQATRVEEESELIEDDDISVYSDELVESDDDDEEHQDHTRQAHRRDAEESRRQQLRYEEEEEDRMRFEIEEEERERREEEAERVRFEEEQAEQRRRIQEKKNQAERQMIEQQEEDERRQVEERKEQRLRFKREEADRKKFEEAERERYAKQEAEKQQREEEQRQAEMEEERRIEQIAARMQAEDEAAEAEEEKQRELAKAEEKIRAAFAGMAKERGQEPLVVPKMQRSGGDNGISLLRRAQTDLRDVSKPSPPLPGGNGVSRYNTVGGGAGPRQMNKPLPSPAGVSRGNTTGMKPPGGVRGLPNGPRAGLPSGPRPRGRA